MSNFVEYDNKIAFHPGFYLKEIVDDSGLTQEDFAKRLGTTPKNLSIILRGDQSLSKDIAGKLSRMLGTSISYWLNLQKTYDEKCAEFQLKQDLEKEKKVFKFIDYGYFRDFFDFPELLRNIEEKVKRVREFLSICSLTVLQNRDLTISFRSYTDNMSVSNIVNANVMVQIAINKTINIESPKYDKKQLQKVIPLILEQTKNHASFLPIITELLKSAGVILIPLPNLKNSGINGATKKVNGKVMLMVNDRRHYADTFWFSMFHEIGHIINGDLGITVNGESEDEADLYAKDILIPNDKYKQFVERGFFSEKDIVEFAEIINRDPGIIYGRLQNDKIIPYTEKKIQNKLRYRYDIS